MRLSEAKGAASKEKEDSDAYILAEFEKRFGKRIKLGDDSDTYVLGSGSHGAPKEVSILCCFRTRPKRILA